MFALPRRYRLLPAFFCFFSLVSAQPDTLIDARDRSPLDTLQQAILYDLMRTLPDGGELGFALIDGHETIFQGLRRQNGKLITVDNADRGFRIGSITKVFTATLLADLVTDGALSLDDTVTAAYGFSFADNIAFTYRQLATHTSGLPRLPHIMPGVWLTPDNPYASFTPDQLETYLRDHLYVLPAGNGGYSNLGFGLLGYTLGSRFDTVGYAEALRKRVFEPLAMAHTSFGIEDARSPVAGLNADGSAATFWTFTEALGGGGALVSTPRDVVRFLRAQLDPGQATLVLTRERHAENDAEHAVGLGWQILSSAPGQTVYWHNGAVGGYRSFMAIDVEGARGVVVLTNVFSYDSIVDRTGFKLLLPAPPRE
ncbi:serine hydrolase domain-containing protein [Neolewinella xylanilytica]|nr:serine hydrolase [Neolewinella xylanilytica]